MGSLRVDSSTQLYAHKSNQISEHQKNLVVSNPAMEASAVNSFSRNFKKNLTNIAAHRASVPPASRIRNDALKELELTSQKSGTLGLESQLGKVIGGSQSTRHYSRTKDKFRRVQAECNQERVPDTEHLARMRALLVAAHQNEHFIKKLAEGNSYVPAHTDPHGSTEEMGQSFQALYSARNKKI